VIQVDVKGEMKTFAPEEVSAFILGKMRSVAEGFVGKNIQHAVVTVPAYFNDAQRQVSSSPPVRCCDALITLPFRGVGHEGRRHHQWYDSSAHHQRAHCRRHRIWHG
jgi:hypothetical protein